MNNFPLENFYRKCQNFPWKNPAENGKFFHGKGWKIELHKIPIELEKTEIELPELPIELEKTEIELEFFGIELLPELPF